MPVMDLLEKQLSGQGASVEQIIHNEHQRQAAAQVTVVRRARCGRTPETGVTSRDVSGRTIRARVRSRRERVGGYSSL